METLSSNRRSRCKHQDSRLVAEIKYRKELGEEQLSLRQMSQRLRPLGYRLDRDSDCKCNAQYMTGAHAGRTYPHLSLHVVEVSSGLSWGHINARRDENWERLKLMRDTMFSVVHGYVASW